jgi:hypothetical protein
MSGRYSRARHIEVIAANAWCENWVFLVRLGGLFFLASTGETFRQRYGLHSNFLKNFAL